MNTKNMAKRTTVHWVGLYSRMGLNSRRYGRSNLCCKRHIFNEQFWIVKVPSQSSTQGSALALEFKNEVTYEL